MFVHFSRIEFRKNIGENYKYVLSRPHHDVALGNRPCPLYQTPLLCGSKFVVGTFYEGILGLCQNWPKPRCQRNDT